MCTRFVLEGAAARAGFARLGLDALAAAVDAALDRFNIAPGAELPALRAGARPGTARVFRPRWGFAPPAGIAPVGGENAGDAQRGRGLLVNARAESLAERPLFREAFRQRRCLVPATGFYEWEKRGRGRLPWLFRRADGLPFAFAALWAQTTDDPAGTETGAVIVTTGANELMAPIHDRMPALLASPAACRAWLDTRAPEADLRALLAPAPGTEWTATPVSPRMNRASVDDAGCVRPAAHGLAPRDEASGAQLPGL